MAKGKTTDLKLFERKLAGYKQLVDDDIAAYSQHIQKTTLSLYGAEARVATDAYLAILGRGGKRIRGSLTMLGYEMLGGKDTKMIIQAARAVEMIHAYILIMDDIQDRSTTRRGGPTAHIDLADYHRQHELSGNAEHFGMSIALNAMSIGEHAAQMILANLDVSEDLRLKAISILNSTMIITSHGQTNDIMNEVVASVDEDALDRVLEWKTAHYSFLNPIHMGMVLACADCVHTDAITEYAMHAGRAFQITDDILGVFGSEFESGKSPMDDIKEGKRTILTVYALNHAEKSDKNFLVHMLGNRDITQAEFAQFKSILIDAGALKYAKAQAERHVEAAQAALVDVPESWEKDCVLFLHELVGHLIDRKS